MQQCHRCKTKFESSNSWFMDYCAICSQSLCDDCMASGCCGSLPARSGRKVDYDDADFEIEPRLFSTSDSVPVAESRAVPRPQPLDTDPA